jgi:hypothetical protein
MRAIADLVLAAAAGVCVLALLYVLYHYQVTGEREFSGAAGPLVYYGFTALSGAFFVLSLRFPPPLRVQVALSTVVTGLAVYSAEFALDIVDPKASPRSARTLWSANTVEEVEALVDLARRYGVHYDTRTHLEVVRDLRAEGIMAASGMYPLGFLSPQADGSLVSRFTIDGVEAVLFGGLSRRTTVLCNEAGVWITYESDEHGFHNPHGLWDLEHLDVVTLGDSYTQGMCVPSERNFAAVIRDRYPGTLNLGMANTGPLISLAMLKEYAAAFRPKRVLWFFYEGNDLSGLTKEHLSPLLMRYLRGPFVQGLRHVQAEVDSLLEDYVAHRLRTMPEDPRPLTRAVARSSVVPAFVHLPKLRALLGLALGGHGDHRVVTDETMDLFGAILAEAQRVVEGWGGDLYLIYLPDRERYAMPSAAELYETNRSRVHEIAHSLGLPVVDVHEAFEAHGDPLALFPFRRRGHYNEEGHRLVGEAVLTATGSP